MINETVSKHRHEEATTAIDREVHQDHYHTSIQPVKDREVLPERHEANILPVENREHYHGDDAAIKARLEQEAAQFRNTRTEGSTRESHSVAPTIAGEHIHHHVHETIQPIVQKETIQPSVVHTTIPIHEDHHNEAQHDSATALPAVSMADFKRQGGVLTGREERYDGFEGEPRAIGQSMGSGSGTTGATGNTGNEFRNDGLVDSSRRGTTGTGPMGTTNAGYENGSSTTGTTTGKKPSLLDRLNPMKDTDGDGKRGIND